jgi:hypothetical protein
MEGQIMTDFGAPHTELAPADRAVSYMLNRITRDPRLAYFMGSTEALRLLCHAEAIRLGVDPAAHHEQINRGLHSERPVCSQCRESAV